MSKKMVKGVLKTWKEDRGFGFIKPDDDGKDIFIHISALKGVSRRPITGDVIYYQIARDSRGKYKAINAQIEGLSIAEDKVEDLLKISSSKKRIVAMAAGLLIFIAIVVLIYIR
jgi:CspA family cold shock protein